MKTTRGADRHDVGFGDFEHLAEAFEARCVGRHEVLRHPSGIGVTDSDEFEIVAQFFE
jgi:hypothetical protein